MPTCRIVALQTARQAERDAGWNARIVAEHHRDDRVHRRSLLAGVGLYAVTRHTASRSGGAKSAFAMALGAAPARRDGSFYAARSFAGVPRVRRAGVGLKAAVRRTSPLKALQRLIPFSTLPGDRRSLARRGDGSVGRRRVLRALSRQSDLGAALRASDTSRARALARASPRTSLTLVHRARRRAAESGSRGV